MRFRLALLLACVLPPLGALAQTESAPEPMSPAIPSFGHFDAARRCQWPAICDSFGAPAPKLPFVLLAPQAAKAGRFNAPALLPQVAENEGVRTVPEVKPRILLRIVPGSATCYSIRGYEYAPTDPASGGTHPTGQTTCQVASTVHRKWVTGTAAPK